MGRRTWIKIFADNWLRGTLREETPSIRGIWIDVLALAGDSTYGDEGLIQVADGVGLTDEQIAAVLCIKENEWLEAKQRLVDTKRLQVSKHNVIKILNWKKYQSEYLRQRGYRQKLQPKVTTQSAPEKREERRENREIDKEDNMVSKQNEALLASFPNNIQSLVVDYIDLARLENKTKTITEGRKLRLITEISNFLKEAGPEHFQEALKITCDKQAPNINYLKKVLKNLRKRATKKEPVITGARGGDPKSTEEVLKERGLLK